MFAYRASVDAVRPWFSFESLEERRHLSATGVDVEGTFVGREGARHVSGSGTPQLTFAGAGEATRPWELTFDAAAAGTEPAFDGSFAAGTLRMHNAPTLGVAGYWRSELIVTVRLPDGAAAAIRVPVVIEMTWNTGPTPADDADVVTFVLPEAVRQDLGNGRVFELLGFRAANGDGGWVNEQPVLEEGDAELQLVGRIGLAGDASTVDAAAWADDVAVDEDGWWWDDFEDEAWGDDDLSDDEDFGLIDEEAWDEEDVFVGDEEEVESGE